jgi:molybdenum cofactor cytidylyltransferase
VLLAATTHLAINQLTLADHHFTLLREADLDGLVDDLPAGLLLFTSPPGDDGRSTGLSEGLVERLSHLADDLSLPLLVEADGSRQLPLKAPAPHEPVIPGWVKTVMVVAGLSGLGKPLNHEWVHRPELFSRLANLDLDAPVTPEGLARVLSHPQGGLKGIPLSARRVALLNQAGTAELQAVAQRLARPLLTEFAGVVVADLPLPSLRTREEDRTGVIAVHERVAGVILAAGGAQRMQQPKQALIWRGQPLVRHVALAALEAGLDPIVVVTGSAADQVEAAVEGLPVLVANNPEWQAGQSGSVKIGLQALPAETGAAVFLLADQPQTPVGLIASLVETHAATLSPLVAPLVQGQRANPVLMDRVTFSDLFTLSGDQGGRALFARYPVQWVPWHDSAILQDIDTPDDYQRLLET